jgi:hypothetical protein
VEEATSTASTDKEELADYWENTSVASKFSESSKPKGETDKSAGAQRKKNIVMKRW